MKKLIFLLVTIIAFIGCAEEDISTDHFNFRYGEKYACITTMTYSLPDNSIITEQMSILSKTHEVVALSNTCKIKCIDKINDCDNTTKINKLVIGFQNGVTLCELRVGETAIITYDYNNYKYDVIIE